MVFFFGRMNMNDLLLQLLLDVHLSLGVGNLRSCPAEWCLCSAGNCGHAFSNRWLSPEIFLSSRRGMTILKWQAFHFWVIAMYPTLVPCNNAVQKTITLTFITTEILLTCFQCYSLLFGHNVTRHPSRTRFCNPNLQSIISLTLGKPKFSFSVMVVWEI